MTLETTSIDECMTTYSSMGENARLHRNDPGDVVQFAEHFADTVEGWIPEENRLYNLMRNGGLRVFRGNDLEASIKAFIVSERMGINARIMTVHAIGDAVDELSQMKQHLVGHAIYDTSEQSNTAGEARVYHFPEHIILPNYVHVKGTGPIIEYDRRLNKNDRNLVQKKFTSRNQRTLLYDKGNVEGTLSLYDEEKPQEDFREFWEQWQTQRTMHNSLPVPSRVAIAAIEFLNRDAESK